MTGRNSGGSSSSRKSSQSQQRGSRNVLSGWQRMPSMGPSWNICVLRNVPRLVHLQDLFPAMGGVADESLSAHVDHKVQVFERNLADKDGHVIRDLGNFDRTIATLDGQADYVVDADGGLAGAGHARPFSNLLQSELLDVARRQ